MGLDNLKHKISTRNKWVYLWHHVRADIIIIVLLHGNLAQARMAVLCNQGEIKEGASTLYL